MSAYLNLQNLFVLILLNLLIFTNTYRGFAGETWEKEAIWKV
jgi:hypothetical protein